MRIFELAAELYGLRQSNKEDPTKAGFSLYKKVNIKDKTFDVMTIKKEYKTIIHQGDENTETTCTVCYADQNPHGTSYEAQLVKSGKMLYHHIAWLWIQECELIPKRIWLCKINHMEGITLLYPRVTYNDIPDALGPFVEIERSTNILHIKIP